MRLSFVIPAHNEEAVIAKCLSSIVEQLKDTHHDAEIIVVANACTDATKRIASSFRGVRVVDEPQKGLVQARRAGFLASHGDVIANIDADTMLTPGWIDEVVYEFSKNARLVALSGPFIFYDVSVLTRALVKIFYALGYLLYLINRFALNSGSMLQGGNFIVRRDALERIGGYNHLAFNFYGEDTDLARRLRAVGPVIFTFRLPIYSSGRRLLAEGLFTVGMRYAINYIWTIFLKRPFTKNSTDIRSEKK